MSEYEYKRERARRFIFALSLVPQHIASALRRTDSTIAGRVSQMSACPPHTVARRVHSDLYFGGWHEVETQDAIFVSQDERTADVRISIGDTVQFDDSFCRIQ